MSLSKLVTWHFYVVVWLSIVGAALIFQDPDLILVDEEGLFGPLRNNLLIAVGYLMIGQIGFWFLKYIKGGYFEAMIMGYTFGATAFGATVYGEVNGLPVSVTFIWALAYVALAHALYYFFGRPESSPK
jgi:hypothetical protein